MIVRRGPGLLGTMARTAVVAGTATAVSGRMGRHHQAWAAEQEARGEQEARVEQEARAPQHAAPVPQGEPPTAAGLTTRLTELVDLKAAGAITEEEFAAAKAKLLGI
jgi:hypothetical protein